MSRFITWHWRKVVKLLVPVCFQIDLESQDKQLGLIMNRLAAGGRRGVSPNFPGGHTQALMGQHVY